MLFNLEGLFSNLSAWSKNCARISLSILSARARVNMAHHLKIFDIRQILAWVVIITYLACNANAIIPDAKAAAAEDEENRALHFSSYSVVYCKENHTQLSKILQSP